MHFNVHFSGQREWFDLHHGAFAIPQTTPVHCRQMRNLTQQMCKYIRRPRWTASLDSVRYCRTCSDSYAQRIHNNKEVLYVGSLLVGTREAVDERVSAKSQALSSRDMAASGRADVQCGSCKNRIPPPCCHKSPFHQA